MPFIAVFFCFYCKVDGRMVRIQVKVGEGGGAIERRSACEFCLCNTKVSCDSTLCYIQCI